jgi:hypothetical protein
MPRFLVKVTIDDYWQYVIEAANEDEAEMDAQECFDMTVNQLRPTIELAPVPDDTPLGDA